MRPRVRTIALLVLAALTVALVGPAAGAQPAEPTIEPFEITSFDGTAINSTLFLPPGASVTAQVPLVLRTHGWGGTGETAVRGTLAKLLEAGYAVITWDSRGFGKSGGSVDTDSPALERRDASALIDYAAARPEILLDGPGDPRVGWTGGSYAGGIQLVTGAMDPRVDVIAPEITWFDLVYSLGPNGVVKTGWAELLYGAGLATAVGLGIPAFETGQYASDIHMAHGASLLTGEIDDASRQYYTDRSLAGYGAEHPLAIPTLVMQGSVDTLFNLNMGAAIYDHVRGNGAPAKYVVFCGGHVACPTTYTAADDRAFLDQAILTWFARHLDGDTSVDTGAPVEYRTNDGAFRQSATFPTATLGATGPRTLTGTAAGTVVNTAGPMDGDGAMASPIQATPSRPGPGVMTAEIASAAAGPVEILGIPRARLSLTGTGGSHLFVKLIDREANHVLNVQELPLRVEGLGAVPQVVETDLVGLAYSLPAGHHLDLQIATTSTQSLAYRGPGSVNVAAEVAVPVRARTVDRLAGPDRVATAAAVAAEGFDATQTVVLARADRYPDALAGGPLAATLDAPLLLTNPTELSAPTAEAIRALGATRAVLLGGDVALAPQVVADLRDLGVEAERIAGTDRFATAAAIAARVPGDGAYLVQGIASGAEDRGWVDAVAVSALAAHQRRPIVLTATDALPAASAAALTDRRAVTVVGGPAAVGEAVASAAGARGATVGRIAGATRYETSRAVAEASLAAGLSAAETWLATGNDYPDALAAGPSVARRGATLLLIDGRSLDASPGSTPFLAAHAGEIERLVLVGGEQAVAPAVADAARAALG